jgi:hypothetical protein
MTVTWPKTVAYSLLAVVTVLGMVVAILGFVVTDLRSAATHLESVAEDQRDTLEGQADAEERSECLTSEYKEFFAGTAQALYAVLEDRPPPQDAIDRLSRAARVLPDIDTICADS